MNGDRLVFASTLALTMLSAPLFGQDHRTPEQRAAARQAMIAWFECVECTNSELSVLRSFGPSIENALITTLQRGLTPAKRAQLEQELRDAYLASRPLPMTEDEYVSIYIANKDARYRSRAATALGQLATPNARVALRRAAAASDLRPDVRAIARKAFDELPP